MFKNKDSTEVPEKGSTDRKETKKTPVSGFLMVLLALMAMIMPASAAEMNWTTVTNMLDGVTTIFPSIANMVTELVPILLLLAVVGFVLRFFDAIIHAITSALSFIK